MPRPIVIIHGWSDSSASFRSLGRALAERLNRPVEVINLADYESQDDQVGFDDVVAAMAHEWERRGLPTQRGSVDAVVHSTGGLVIRDWLIRNYSATAARTDSPIRRLVMLAPANFGSPLAHKGRSFIGRVIKGWSNSKMLQVGERLLKGLELASPYTWNLALGDRFGGPSFYGKGKILCTVLVGNTGYTGIAAAANEDGSDGTVRVSTANLNCAYMTADFTDRHNPVYRMYESDGRTAFAIMDGENHSSIKTPGRNENPHTLDRIVRGLTITDATFDRWCDQLSSETAEVMARREAGDDRYYYAYQNTVFFVRDQFNHHVRDYFLEFYTEDSDAGWFEEMFHREAIRSVHAYSGDSSLRSVLVDRTTLGRRIDKADESMRMSLTALPELRVNKNVGYATFADKDMGGVRIPHNRIGDVFQPNRTLLVEVILKREQAERLFRMRAMG